MIGAVFRAALILAVSTLLDIILHEFGDPLLNDVADPSNLPGSAPPLVEWGQSFIDWFYVAVLLSLFVYLLVAAWRDNTAPGGLR